MNQTEMNLTSMNQTEMNQTGMNQMEMVNTTTAAESMDMQNQSTAINQTAAAPAANVTAAQPSDVAVAQPANITEVQPADVTMAQPANVTARPANVTAQSAAAAARPAVSAAAAPSGIVPATVTGSIRAENQSIANNQVTVAEVASNSPAWVVIRPNLGTAPDTTRTLGYAHVDSGTATSVNVPITGLNMTSGSVVMLWAVLQKDGGQIGVFEYPGPDVFVRDASGQNVRSFFQATMA